MSEENGKDNEDAEDWDPIAELLFDITEHFGLEADIEYEERTDHVRYHIEGPDMGVLIGRRGSTLNALQFLIGVINARKKLVDYRVVVDVESYRDRREKQLIDQAKREAAKVVRDGREKVLASMPAAERRVIHLALAEWEDVVTYSEGKDPDRCVVIAPADGEHDDED
jgi:spoIIIJ-associated protein